MTAAEFLAKEARRFGLLANKAFDGDYDLRVVTIEGRQASASDLIQLAANLHEVGYGMTFMKDNSIHVHAPHRKEHSWGDRGWGCDHGLTVEGCETFRLVDKYKDVTKETLLATREKTVKLRDECMGDLYRSAMQDNINEIDKVLEMRR